MATQVVHRDNKYEVILSKTIVERCYDIKKWFDGRMSNTIVERRYNIKDSSMRYQTRDSLMGL